ncbi:MAG TPA: hypothetical protein VLC10_05165 [Patescibacteria group bacterium]|nr:hypothetical protein [Patescibacteria group bacterium]
MADAPATPTPWLDLLDEDIPVVDKSGKQLLVKGLDFVDPAKGRAAPQAAPVAGAPAAPAAPLPPPNLPMGEPAPVPAALEKAPVATRADFGLEADKDLADIKKIEALVAKKSVSVETKAEANLLDVTVEQAAASTGAALPDDDMRRRYRMLISLYFRDLRDALETKSKFTMPVQSGGMGMAEEEAEKVMAELRSKNDEYHAAMQGKAVEDKAKYVAEQTEKVLGAQDRLDKKDEERMEQAFTGLMQRTGVAAPGAAVPPPPAGLKEPRVVPVVGLDAKGKAIPPVAPAPAPATAPGAAAPSAAPAAAPAVSEVKYSPRLTGPVEELRSMSLKDFRRLSRDPREATLKLKDKIDLLEEQSFDMKTQGIKAWQDSEVNKLYLDILRSSLEGKPVTDVITDLENKAAPYLSKAEFDSIMELNRKLRFG